MGFSFVVSYSNGSGNDESHCRSIPAFIGRRIGNRKQHRTESLIRIGYFLVGHEIKLAVGKTLHCVFLMRIIRICRGRGCLARHGITVGPQISVCGGANVFNFLLLGCSHPVESNGPSVALSTIEGRRVRVGERRRFDHKRVLLFPCC